MLDGLRDLPIVGDVRGAGFFQALELVKDQDTKESFSDEESETLLRGFLSGALYEAGLICRADDRGDPVVQLSPPLIADTEQFEEIDSILRDVLTRAWDQIVEALTHADGRQLGRGTRAGTGRRPVGGGDARPLGPHHRAARPHALAVGRRAAADHRPPGQGDAELRAFVRRLESTAWPAWASASASSTSSSRRRCSTRRRSSASRCSRSPMTSRSSR